MASKSLRREGLRAKLAREAEERRMLEQSMGGSRCFVDHGGHFVVERWGMGFNQEEGQS